MSARFILLPILGAVVLAGCAARPGSAVEERGPARPPDSVSVRQVVPGVVHRRIVSRAPWVLNVLEIDLRRGELDVRSARATGRLRGRETTSSIARRASSDTTVVVAAINADFFDLRTGEQENNQVIDGAFVKGVHVTDSPHDTFDNIHSQFALGADRRPYIERFAFAGAVVAPAVAPGAPPVEVSAVNAAPRATRSDSTPDSTVVLFNTYYGDASPPDTLGAGASAVSAITLTELRRAGDTIIYRVQGGVRVGGSSPIPGDGAVLAGYGRAQTVIDRLQRSAGPSGALVIVLGVRPVRGAIRTLVGGWPRIVTDGRNVAAQADSAEGTFQRFSAERHPRTGVGFSRDSATLYFITVDGRQATSRGMTLAEFADAIIALGVYQGLNLDGGGSTTLVIGDAVVNSPSDAAGERPVANALLLTRRRPVR